MDPTKLRNVRRIISHAHCPDGIASAWLCKNVLPDAEVEFVFYDETYASLPASHGMLFCDISPPRARVDEFLDVGAIVLDHHATQQDVVMRFAAKGLGVYGAEPGVSGAVLCYRHVFERMMTERLLQTPGCSFPEHAAGVTDALDRAKTFAALVGIYDTWQRGHQQWDAACATTSLLMFHGFDYFIGRDMVGLYPIEDKLGAKIHSDRLARARRAVDERLVIASTAWGEMAFFNDDYHDPLSSLVGERAREVRDSEKALSLVLANVQATVAYRLEPWSYRYSMRQVHPDFDCSKLAKALGGGGHVGAAGITFDKVDEKFHPVEYFCQQAAATEDVP